jgi:tetratricopeptide (TPR) repeat protein
MGGMTGEALAAIDRALELRPDDLAALSLGHDILVAAGQIDEAIRRAERLLHWAPLDLLTMRRLVDCRCQMRMTQGADGLQTRWLLRRASRLSHNPLLVREPRAAFFLSRGEPQKALAVHREFLEQHPQCPGGREDYSRVLAATGQEELLGTALRGWELTPAQGCNGACRRHIMAEPLRA